MDLSILKFPGGGLEKIESLQQLRERLLVFLLQAAFIPATILYVLAIIPVFQKGLSIVPLIYTILFAWYSINAFVHRIPYVVRAGSWALLFYIFGIVNLSLSGLNVDGGLFFLTYILMVSLFFDLRQGLVALGISLVSIVLFGFLTTNGDYVPGLALPQTALMLWVIGGTILVSTGLLLILPIIVLMRGLVGFLEKARKESKELEEANFALRSSEERYRSLVEISPDLISLIDLQGNILITNQSDLDTYGYDGGDLLRNGYLSFIAPEDRTIAAEAFLKTIESGSARDIICRCLRKDGTHFYSEFDTNLIRNKDGEPESVIIIGRDITDRMVAERVLKFERMQLETTVVEKTNELFMVNEMLKALVTRSPAIIYVSGLEKNSPLTYISQNVFDYTGYPPEYFVSDPGFWHSLLHPEHVTEYEKWIPTISQTGESMVEYQIRTRQGEYRWVRDAARFIFSPEGEPIGVVGVCIDVTELKNAEQSYRTLVDKSIQGIAVYQEGRIVYGNQRMADSFGISLDELKSLLPVQIVDFLHPDDQEMVWSRYQSRLEGFADSESHEIRIQQTSGEIRYLIVSTNPITYGGKPAIQISAFDITERRKIEQALHESEETERTILNATSESLVLVDPNKVMVAVNQSACRFTGLPVEEMLGSSLFRLFPEELARVGIHFDTVIDTGEPVNFEESYNNLVFDINLYPVFDDYGQVARVLIAGRDITERRQIEKALRESEEIGRTIMNATAELLVLTDTNINVIAVNQSTCKLMGVQPGDLVGKPLSNWGSESSTGRRMEYFTSVLKTGEPKNFVEPVGNILLDVDLYPVFDDYGQVSRVLIVGKDMTERSKMEEALRESENVARAMMNAVPSGMALIDSTGVILAANKAAAGWAGMEVEELTGRNVNLIFPDDQNSTRKNRLVDVIKTGIPMQFVDFRQGRWLDVSIHPIQDEHGRIGQVVVSVIDQTAYKQLEEALSESEQTLRAMINATPASLLMIAKDGTALAANEIAAERLGKTLEGLLGKVIYQFFPEEVARLRKAHVDDVFLTGLPIVFEDCRANIWYENHIYPVMNEDGQVMRVVVSARDVTRRKEMDQALRESEATWRIMMNATPSALGMLDSDGRLLAANTTLLNRLRLGLDKAVGRTMFELLPQEVASTRKAHMDKVFQTGQQVQFEDNRNGIWFENHMYPLQNDDGQVTRVVFSSIDLTDRKLIEQSLKADKEELEVRVAERTQELSESREQLRTLAADMVATQEEERRRISRELHDEAGQALVSMKYSLESIIADLKGRQQPIAERLAFAIRQVDETMEQIRFLAHSLRPPLLDIADLDLTLRDYCNEIGESTKLKVEYIGASLPSLTDQAELGFFRFLQEALTNVLKHARATQVKVRLKKSGSFLSLIVVDNGSGGKSPMGTGQGHVGMQERFRVLDGQVRIRTGFGEGFIVLARVPYQSVLKTDGQAV
jgi:PAS domain S-box-containing protein